MNDKCDHLDAYLSGELAAPDVALFELHAAECAECRESIDQQRWIDALLRSPTRLDLESPAVTLLDSVRNQLSNRSNRVSRRRQLVAAGCAVAAMVLIAIGWALLPNDRQSQASDSRRKIAAIEPAVGAVLALTDEEQGFAGNAAREELASDLKPPKATFVGTGDTIGVPVASSETNITIVRLYSAYRPADPRTFAVGQLSSSKKLDLEINN